MKRVAALLLLASCAPVVPSYDSAVSACPWPVEDFAAVDDVLTQRWPLHLTPDVHVPDLVDALRVVEVVCVTDGADYPALDVAGHTRVAGQYLSVGPTGVPTIHLAGGYDDVASSAYAQEAIHALLDLTGRDAYLTEDGVDVGAPDEPLREALWALEDEARGEP